MIKVYTEYECAPHMTKRSAAYKAIRAAGWEYTRHELPDGSGVDRDFLVRNGVELRILRDLDNSIQCLEYWMVHEEHLGILGLMQDTAGRALLGATIK